ncbi:protein split ends [Trichonephila clavipes]|nr:protein split ends [Trichonephila clavipes]
MMYSESGEEVENNRLVPPTSAIGPHNSRQPQHAHYASRIFQFSTHIPSPHDRTTDSPVAANLCNAQGRISQISLAGQVDDHSLGVHSSHLYKNDVVGRSSNPAHSPNSHSYKKDTGHSQQIASLHNPASDKIVSSDHSAKAYNARTLDVSYTPHLTVTECARLYTPHLTVTECVRFSRSPTPTETFWNRYGDFSVN